MRATRQRDVPAAASTHRRRATQPHRAIQSADASPDLTFQVEYLRQFARELTPLLVAHHTEIERDRFPLDPDWDEWYRLNALGLFRMLTARADGVLVGYVANVMRTSLWSKTTLLNFIQAFYMAPSFRSGWSPVKMFLENQRYLDEWGVKRTYVTVELTYLDGRARSIFDRLGYEMTAEVWER